MKRAHVVQIKHNEVVNYLIQHTQHKKSKYQRSNLSIQEIGRVRKRKNPRGRRKKWKQPWQGKLGCGIWIHARRQDPWLWARSRDPRLRGRSHRSWRRARSQDLWLRYRSRKRHIGCPAVQGQAPRNQDLWRRDVLSRSHEFWRRLIGSKDEFMSLRSQT